MSMSSLKSVIAASAVMMAAASSSVAQTVNTRVFLASDSPLPDLPVSTQLRFFREVSLNDGGDLVVTGTVNPGTDELLWAGSTTSVQLQLRSGQPVFGPASSQIGHQPINSFQYFGLDTKGNITTSVAFDADSWAYLSGKSSSFDVAFQSSDIAPGTGTTFIGQPVMQALSSFDDDFIVDGLLNTGNTLNDDVTYIGNGNRLTNQIFRENPATVSSPDGVNTQAINGGFNASGGYYTSFIGDIQGLYIGETGSSSLNQVFENGDLPSITDPSQPTENLKVSSISRGEHLTEDGDLFISNVILDGTTTDRDRTFSVRDNSGNWEILIREGDDAPGFNSDVKQTGVTISTVHSLPNDDIIMQSSLKRTTIDSTKQVENTTIFDAFYKGNTNGVTPVFTTEDPRLTGFTPSPSGGSINEFATNDAGQIAFKFNQFSGGEDSLWLLDTETDTLLSIVNVGDEIEIAPGDFRTVSFIRLDDGLGDEQLAFAATFEDGSDAVLVTDFTIPEPTTMTLVGCLGVATLLRRRG